MHTVVLVRLACSKGKVAPLKQLTMPQLELMGFVGNRVAQIQQLMQNNTWRYVNTTENPADYVSREIHPCKIM